MSGSFHTFKADSHFNIDDAIAFINEVLGQFRHLANVEKNQNNSNQVYITFSSYIGSVFCEILRDSADSITTFNPPYCLTASVKSLSSESCRNSIRAKDFKKMSDTTLQSEIERLNRYRDELTDLEKSNPPSAKDDEAIERARASFAFRVFNIDPRDRRSELKLDKIPEVERNIEQLKQCINEYKPNPSLVSRN